jgi:hypothetical protein
MGQLDWNWDVGRWQNYEWATRNGSAVIIQSLRPLQLFLPRGKVMVYTVQYVKVEY